MEVLDGDPLQSEDVGKYFGDGAVLIYEKENQQSFSEARRERDEKIRRTSKGNLGDSENLQKRERSSSEDEGTLPDDGVKLSLRESDNLSNRELLANAHMGAAQADEIEQAGRDLESDLYNSGVKCYLRGYDITKSFAEQIDDYKAGIFPQHDTLIIGTTPDVFLRIGLNRFPMTYARGHLKDVLKGTKADHDFGEAILKQLPNALKKPVAVIASQTQTSTSLVALLELSHNGKQIIAVVHIDGGGMQNGIAIDSNAVTTMHKRGNALELLKKAINAEAAGAVVYYLDNEKTTRLLQYQGLQLPNILKNSSGYIHNIMDTNSPVKPKLGSALESQQFIRWFGDWMTKPNAASKVVDNSGKPLVMWHGTNTKFNTFDRNKIGSRGAGKYLGYGFNFAASEDTARTYGSKNVMPVYLNIRRGLSSKEKTIQVSQLSSIIRKLESDIEDVSYSLVWDYSHTGYNITPKDSAGVIAAKYNKALNEARSSGE